MPIEPNVPQSKPSRDQTSDLAPTLAQTVTPVELRGYRETDEPEPIEDIETTEHTGHREFKASAGRRFEHTSPLYSLCWL